MVMERRTNRLTEEKKLHSTPKIEYHEIEMQQVYDRTATDFTVEIDKYGLSLKRISWDLSDQN